MPLLTAADWCDFLTELWLLCDAEDTWTGKRLATSYRRLRRRLIRLAAKEK